MKGFFKIFFASLLAIIVASFIPFIIFIGFITMVSSSLSSDTVVTIKNNTILKIDLSKPIVDAMSESPMDYLDINTLQVNAPSTVLSSLRAIENAASDPRIDAIYIESSMGVALPLSTLEEMRSALLRFKASGKKIYSYSDNYTAPSYYISSVADSVILSPIGDLGWYGMSGQVIMFKDFLEKFGVEMQVVRVGKYKGAVEPFMLSKMSDENRMQQTRLLTSIWDGILTGVQDSRGVAKDELNKYATNLMLPTANSAVEYKLVDTLMYKDQFKTFIEQQYGADVNFISLSKYASTLLSMRSTDGKGNPVLTSKNRIAVVYASGTIVDGKGSAGEIGDVPFNATIAELREDSLVKAVVLRVNSPGGSAPASERMWRELYLLQQKKPLIISMGSYAASGGYYISCVGDAIFSDPATITGSIGVFATIPNVQKATKMLGLNIETVHTNPNADIYTNLFAPKTTPQLAYIQGRVDDVYDLFIKRVADGRNISQDRVREIAQGRVYSGVDAKELGLVDELGSFTDAVLFAAQKANITESFIVEEKLAVNSPFALFFKTLSSTAILFTKPDLGVLQGHYDHFMHITQQSEVQAVIPYRFDL